MTRAYVLIDKVGAETAYQLFKPTRLQRLFGMLGEPIAFYVTASDALYAIGSMWPGKNHGERLFAVYENGNSREVHQTMELLKQVEIAECV